MRWCKQRFCPAKVVPVRCLFFKNTTKLYTWKKMCLTSLCCISLVIFTQGWMQHLISSVISADCWSRSSSMFTSADIWWIIDKVSEYPAPRICDDRAANMFYTTNIQRMTHKPTVNIKINLDEAIEADFSETFAFLPIKTGCDDCERRLTDGCWVVGPSLLTKQTRPLTSVT